MAIGSYVEELKKRMNPARELAKFGNQSKYGFEMPEKPMVDFSEPQIGSTFKTAQAASLEANPTLDTNTDLSNAAKSEGSGITSDTAGAGITAGASTITNLMKAMAEQQQAKSKMTTEMAGEIAKGSQRSAEMQARGTVGPLRELIASYRAALR